MNKVIVACAGSGKTTYIVKKAIECKDKKILITTFTDSNVEEIKNKIININGSIPSNISVLPWFTFQLDHLIKPYQLPLIDERIKGITLVNGKSGKFISKNKKEYYLKDGVIFSDKISNLAYRTISKNKQTLVRLKLLFDYIFIDEFQDFSGFDLDIIKEFSYESFPMIIVCDPRQHTFSTHYDCKNKKYNCEPLKFVQEKCNEAFQIDDKTLNGSYRCPNNTIMYASKIFPEYSESHSLKKYQNGDGIIFIPKSKIDVFLMENFDCLQLRYNKNEKVREDYPVLTFGKSKGLTVENVLIYPTINMLQAIRESNFKILEAKTKSNLYVALTRAKHKTAIVVSDEELQDFDEIKKHIDSYIN